MRYRICDVTLGYKNCKPILENLSLEIPSGELIAIVGRNGVGKSTLLRLLAAGGRPIKGDIMIDDQSIFSMSSNRLAEEIAFVTTENIRVEHLSVRDVVSFGRAPYTNWVGDMSEQDRAITNQAIQSVGVEQLADVGIDRLSDGERQRVMIARAIAQQSSIILLDEPSAFLDLPNRYQIVMLLRQIAHQGQKTVIFSSHDLATAIRLSDRIWIMSPGKMTCGTPKELMANRSFDTIFEGTPLRFDSCTGDITCPDESL